MSKVIKVKNTGADDTWVGMIITQNTYYQIEDQELGRWKTNLKVFTDIASGVLLVNDGTSDITDALTGWDYLASSTTYVKPDPSQQSEESKYQKVVVQKSEGSSSTKVTHDYCDRTTWYSEATQVTGGALTLDSGTIYDTGHTFLIDATHGKIYGEDSLTSNGQHYKVNLGQGYPSDMRIYNIKVYDNGTLLTEDTDYTVNYVTGKIDFAGYTIQGTLTADFWYANGADYVLAPTAGKILMIEHAELQLAKNCVMDKPISFEVWVYHPDQVTYPGVKIPYQTITYKNIKDILNACNKGTGFFPAMSGLANDVVILPFDYATVKPFRSSLGAELRITMDGTTPIAGEWGTATFYILSRDE